MVLSWPKGGLLLGIVFFLAVLLAKPIGVSTQFVIADGLIWHAFDSAAVVASTENSSGYASPTAYLNRSGGGYAKAVAEPLTYGAVFVLALMVGALVSSRLRGGIPPAERAMPPIRKANFGDSAWRRFLVAFLAGFVVLFGARIAGGCTAGHMMSGLMQTAISGFIFTAMAFLAAVPTAILMYRKEG